MENINLRFIELRKTLKMSQESIGEILGVTRSGVSNIENGFRKVTPKHVKMLCMMPINGKYVNEKWLQSGEGDMFLELPLEDEVASAVSEVLEDIHCENAFYTLIKEILIQHERLDEETQKHVDLFFDNVLKGIAQNKII